MMDYSMFGDHFFTYERESQMYSLIGAIYAIIGFSLASAKKYDDLLLTIIILSMILVFFTLSLILTNLKNNNEVMLIWKLTIVGFLTFAMLYYLEDIIDIQLILIFTVLSMGFTTLVAIYYTVKGFRKNQKNTQKLE